MSYSLRFAGAAKREFDRLPASVKKQITPVIVGLSEEPRPNSCKKLKGTDDCFRVRKGDYRVVYQVQDNVLVVLVIRVGHRREVYRALDEVVKSRLKE